MRVLITHGNFAGFGGTETYMLTLAEQLLRTGHDASIHAPELGEMADFARSRGTPVLGTRELPAACDLVLVQDTPTCLEMSARYPDAVRIFIAHSQVHMLQTPPQVPGFYHALVVLNHRMERWAQGLAWTPPLVRLRQPVDLDRFRVAPPRTALPPRVLVLSHYPFGKRAQVVQEACATIGAELSWLGGQHGVTASPEEQISASDVVLGLGRSVLDAMASARAALVFGPLGGDGWVTEQSYALLERDGFTGRATNLALDVNELTRELRGWQPAMGTASRDLASRHHDVRQHAGDLVELARELAPSGAPPPGLQSELARLVRLEWQRSQSVALLRKENARLMSELQAREQTIEGARHTHEQELLALDDAHTVREQSLRDQLDGLRGHLQSREAKLNAVLRTRRYRTANAAARPLELLRAGRSALKSGRSET